MGKSYLAKELDRQFHVYSVSFVEFLTAKGHDILREEIGKYSPAEEFLLFLHEKLLGLPGTPACPWGRV